MRTLHFRALIAIAILPLLFCSCFLDNKAAETGKAFLENMYSCNFKACDELCTNKGREEVRWFASNLTEDDLALISPDFEIEIKGSEATDSITTVSYYAKNVIICDSLETKGHLGERSLKVTLKNEGGTWKVDKLKW